MVAKFLDLNNLSSQQQPFALSNDGSEAWATVLLLSAIIHRKVIHVNFFSFFFLPDLQDHSLLRSRHFATMVTQHDNFSPLLQSLQTLQESCIYIHLLKLSASDHKYTCIHGWNGRQQYIYIYLLNIWQFIKMCSENPLLRPGHDNTCTMYCKYLNLTKRGCQVFSFCSFQIKKWLIFWENTTGLLPPGHSGCIKGVAIHKGGFSNCTCSQIPCLRCKRTVI